MATLGAAIIGALGTVISSVVAYFAVQTRRAVDGNLTELRVRVQLLELVLSASTDADRPARRPD